MFNNESTGFISKFIYFVDILMEASINDLKSDFGRFGLDKILGGIDKQ